MRDWFRLLAHVVRLMLRVAGRQAWTLAAVMVSQAGGIAGLAIGQRMLIDASVAHQAWGVTGAIALGATAYAVGQALGRVMGRLTVYVNGRTRAAFNEGIQRLVSSIPTITHVEHAPYINRWNRIFNSSWAIATMPWSVLGSLVAVLSLAVTIGLLGSVSPWLCLLAVLGVPMLLATRRADQLHRQARDANSEPLRREGPPAHRCWSSSTNRPPPSTRSPSTSCSHTSSTRSAARPAAARSPSSCRTGSPPYAWRI